VNCYETTDRLKRFLQITSTDRDSDLLFCLESASRAIDDYCNRHFFIETATRYFTGPGGAVEMRMDDLLSLTSLGVDTDEDGVWDDESWTEDTDYVLWPFNGFPKLRIDTLSGGSYSHNKIPRGYEIVGEWGHGDGTSDPTRATAVTGTVADAASTSLAISVSAGLEAGQTISIGSERMFVSAVATTTATVERGVNGSTAAAHTAAAISVYEYPQHISQTALWAASKAFKDIRSAGVAMQSVAGEVSVQYAIEFNIKQVWARALGRYRRDLLGKYT